MLKIENLTKSYGKFKAVNKLSLTINEGEIFGFVGPNGAGKTTTMKMIATLLKPDSGKIYLDEVDLSKDLKGIRERTGYMPDFFGVYDNLKAIEYLEFYGDVAGIPKEERKDTIEDLLALVDLTHKREAYVDSLSRGMKQRLCLARSLIHNPKLLILDEPASGMDPRARVQMKEILKELKRMGKTILISSHILSELAELCDSIGIIENGKIVQIGSVDKIMRKVSKGNLIKIKILDHMERAVTLLKEEPLVKDVFTDENHIEISFDGEEKDTAKIIKKLINNEILVTSFSPIESNLEEIFMKVTKGEEE
ncbi:ABC transporter ATP-binding protein [Crassaminicella profunda]|uniref:ABC transporter ATP-binding protein n=1 Tax=Crassaminicella profunda TaxID=1286698 RepID=UPI001CA6D1B5|nr:ABC transporter ATP-binding protein [Crassaminicella profunda]QZY56098.1 ABC transporter ATP-binding protein [Crassaminicella profunda]